jgi:hypothetical protein
MSQQLQPHESSSFAPPTSLSPSSLQPNLNSVTQLPSIETINSEQIVQGLARNSTLENHDQLLQQLQQRRAHSQTQSHQQEQPHLIPQLQSQTTVS